jgi:hypothetical protein
VVSVALLAASGATAKSLTKTVFAGPPPQTSGIAAKLLPKTFTGRYSPDINAYFNKKTTINAGDSVSFQILGFHTVDFPGKASGAQPLIVPGTTLANVTDAAGNPFWFNGKVPNVGLNPALFAGSSPRPTTAASGGTAGSPPATGRPSHSS